MNFLRRESASGGSRGARSALPQLAVGLNFLDDGTSGGRRGRAVCLAAVGAALVAAQSYRQSAALAALHAEATFHAAEAGASAAALDAERLRRVVEGHADAARRAERVAAERATPSPAALLAAAAEVLPAGVALTRCELPGLDDSSPATLEGVAYTAGQVDVYADGLAAAELFESAELRWLRDAGSDAGGHDVLAFCLWATPAREAR